VAGGVGGGVGRAARAPVAAAACRAIELEAAVLTDVDRAAMDALAMVLATMPS
jgi:hypothetical protein